MLALGNRDRLPPVTGLGPDEPTFGHGPASAVADTEVRALCGELLLLLRNRRTSDGMDVRDDHRPPSSHAVRSWAGDG
ncbi:hypothetical protein GCM10009610_65810 [Pseudonocardia xinjiangensis]